LDECASMSECSGALSEREFGVDAKDIAFLTK
jgi:hypothetical protein